MQNSNSKLQKSYIVALLAMVCCLLWGSAFPCVKIGYELFKIDTSDTYSVILFAGTRFAIAGVLTILIGSIINKKFLYPKKSSLFITAKLSLFQTILQYFFFYIGLAHTTGVSSSIIVASNVFLAILLSTLVYRSEKLQLNKFIGCLIGFSGVVLISVNGSLDASFSLLGEGFVFLSALSYAMSSVLIKKYSKFENPVTLSGYQFLLGGIVMVIISASLGGRLTVFTVQSGFLLLYLAIISAVAYSIWGVLLKYNPVSKVTVYGFMNPVFGVILSALILNEQNQAFTLVGLLSLLLVSVGIFVVNKDFSTLKTKFDRRKNMDFLTLAKKRYSCRKMTDKVVEQEKIEKIIQAGIIAPTAVNFQPVKLFVINNEKGKENIKSCTKYDFDASTFFVVGTDKNSAWVRKFDNKNFSDIDGAIVATHMMLEIENLGLNTTWVGSFDSEILKEKYPAMCEYELIAIFPVGYKDVTNGVPSSNHEKRKSKEDMVEFL